MIVIDVSAIKQLLLYNLHDDCTFQGHLFYRRHPGDCFSIKDTNILRNFKNRLIQTFERLPQHEIFPQIKCKKSGSMLESKKPLESKILFVLLHEIYSNIFFMIQYIDYTLDTIQSSQIVFLSSLPNLLIKATLLNSTGKKN